MKSTFAVSGLPRIALVLVLAAGVSFAGSIPQKPVARTETPPLAWEPLGLSGGGGLFTPSISPVDPDRMMISSDMGGAYVSKDGGANWTMINHAQLMANKTCTPGFHPKDANTIYAASSIGSPFIDVSKDGGRTWSQLAQLPDKLTGAIVIDPDHPDSMLVGAGANVYLSRNGGKSWSPCAGVNGRALGFLFDRTTPADRRRIFAGTDKGAWRSDDGGKSWRAINDGLPRTDLIAFAGASDRSSARLYASVPSEVKNGQLAGGIFVSDDGATWRAAGPDGLNRDTSKDDRWAMGDVAQYPFLLASDARPLTVYALNTDTGVQPPHHATVFRSDDGGKSWKATFYPDPRWKPNNVSPDWQTAAMGQYLTAPPLGAAIAAGDPKRVVIVDGERCFVTKDGGDAWSPCHARRAADGTWINNGLVVTSAWMWANDPTEPKRSLIGYTDIGLARSENGGASWSWWDPKARAPWTNTCYAVVFDPARPGRVWGAFSNVHDIPNANIVMNRHSGEGGGGVTLSDDGGKTWRLTGKGIQPRPVTALLLDTSSPTDNRTLYAGVFGGGVYRSTDDGRNWTALNEGLGTAENRRVAQLRQHADGTMIALITGRRANGKFDDDGAGVYRSRDRGEHWEKISKGSQFRWAKDVTLDPKDSRILWVGTADTLTGHDGGLYQTTDGGATWKLVAREGPETFGAYPHPKRPGWIYMTVCEDAPGAGLWLSKDNGKKFSPVEGFPFRCPLRVQPDPSDERAIIVTTFGAGVWRGPAE